MKFFIAIVCVFVSATLSAQSFRFDLGPGKALPGYTKILPDNRYSHAAGYGFEFSGVLIANTSGDIKPLTDGYITSNAPFYFSVKVPEGNYNIRVTAGDKTGRSVTTIKAECRRLMIEKMETAPGKFITREFTVHVRDSVIRPANTKVRLKPREFVFLHWDDKLTLEFSNTAPKICAIEITRVNDIPTVFLAGNSTVVDQAEEPWAAWGQMIPAFFEPGKLAVANYAESGETLRAFKGEKRFEKLMSMAKPGDWLFIEFAHNDQKPGANFLDPFTTYRQTLKEWIREARERGMIPVLVTSMHRRTFDTAGHIINSLGDYPAAMRQTAGEEHLGLIDLNAMSKTLYEAWGPERSVKAFVHFPANSFPNQPNELKDNTHFTAYGAYELAKCVLKGIRANVPSLAKLIRKDVKTFDPSKPDRVEQWALPVSSFISIKKPDGN